MKIRSWFSHLKIRKKILFCLLILLIITFGITTISSYSIVSGIMHDEVGNLAQISVDQISKNYDLYLDELFRLSNMALSDSNLRSAIKTSGGTAGQVAKSAQDIFQFLSNIYLYRSDLNTVSICTVSGRTYTQGYTTYVSEQNMDDWCREIMSDPESNFRIVGLRSVAYILPAIAKDEEVFTVARRIVDINGQVLGVFVLNTRSDSLLDIFGNVTNQSTAQLYLQDENGEIICQTETDQPPALENGVFRDDSFVMASRILSRTGWKVTIAIPKTSLFTSVHDALSSFYLLMTICLVSMALMYMILTYAFTKPIHRLAQGIKQVSRGDFSTHIEPTASDEIGELTDGFNRMTSQIQSLLNRTVEMEVKEKESEYLVLQSQINPHFLYNTLEAIRMQCVARHEMEIAGVINKLSNLFRLSISRRERFVMLRDELEHVKSYMAIQNFRFDNKYHLLIDVPDELLEYKTFKLMLQPLVENCVFHGLESLPDGGHICISARISDQLMIITIHDDGIGISDEQLESLRAFLADPSSQPDRQSLGLRTVHERIRLFFGETCGLSIDSRENDGTVITLTMPAFKDESEVNMNV